MAVYRWALGPLLQRWSMALGALLRCGHVPSGQTMGGGKAWGDAARAGSCARALFGFMGILGRNGRFLVRFSALQEAVCLLLHGRCFSQSLHSTKAHILTHHYLRPGCLLPQVVGKPSKDFFLAALQSLGASPEQAVMVGDDVRDDVGGAQAAGIRGILGGCCSAASDILRYVCMPPVPTCNAPERAPLPS